MHMILRYANGHRADALLLMIGRDRMRLVLRGENETLEYYRASDRWVGEDGAAVSVEAIVPADLELFQTARGITRAAGGPSPS